jgi:uncharacterized membrane protein YeaQ/YmgE (transglycosylase-associated protein family)
MVFAILTWLAFGFIVGLVARALFPGTQPLGFLPTVALGVLGSFLGGFIASLIGGYPVLELRTAGFIGSLIGALVVLGISSSTRRRRLT